MKVYVVLKNVTYHADGESFDSSIEGVYQKKSDAEKKRDLLESEFEKHRDELMSEFDDDDICCDDEDLPECEIVVEEQELQ